MKPHYADRMMQLEAEVRRLSRRIEQSEAQRLAQFQPPAVCRLAKTWSADEGSYPQRVDGLPAAWPFVFLAPGGQGRSAEVQGEAAWPNGVYLPRETKIAVGEDRGGGYFVLQAYLPATRIHARVGRSFGEGESELEWDDFNYPMSSPYGLDGPLPDDIADAVIENRFAWPGEPGWLAELRLDHTTGTWYLLQMFCDL